MPNVGPMELAIVLVLALLVFGPKKLPEIGKGLGQAMREFKKASREFMNSFNDESEGRSYSHTPSGGFAAGGPETTYPYHPPITEPASAEPAHAAAATPSPAGQTVPPSEASADPARAPTSAGHTTAQAPERTP
jgi:sec-independent protein translocase protein TatA